VYGVRVPVLSRPQQNDIYRIAERAGLKVRYFDLHGEKQDKRGPVEAFINRPTGGWIDFSLGMNGTFWIQWWAGIWRRQ